MPTAALAAANSTGNSDKRGLACVRHYLPKVLARTGNGIYGPARITRLSDPLPGVPGGFAIRIATTLLNVPKAMDPAPVHFYIDTFGFVSGAADVTLTTSSFPRPLATSTQTRLLALLHRRASMHAL